MILDIRMWQTLAPRKNTGFRFRYQGIYLNLGLDPIPIQFRVPN